MNTLTNNMQSEMSRVGTSSNLVVKPVHCRKMPGDFIIKCYRREIHFTWIPPKEELQKVMIKFKQ
ncbi:hypothetical protein CSKR_202709, partial [Clonorchis sinensis]